MVVVHSHRHATRAVVATRPVVTGGAILVAFSATLLTALVALLFLAAAAHAYAPGELIWTEHLDTGAGQAGIRDMAAGPNEAVAVAGWQDLSSGRRAPLVAKYGAAGLEWVRTYDGDAESRGEAQAVAFGHAGDLYVAATVTSATYDCDIVLIKYAADGARQWAVTWDGDGTGYVAARHVAVDKSGDVIVVGTKDVIDDAGRFTVPAAVVLRYHKDGTPAWPAAATYEPASGDASFRTLELSDVALDKAGDVYVCGSLFSAWWGVGSDMEGLALKFAGADGSLVASRTDECPPGTASRFTSIAVRGPRVAIAGMALDLTDYGGIADAHGLVVSFDLNLQDSDRYVWDPGETRFETFNDVELDVRGDVYVTGSQASTATKDLISQSVTVKLDPGLSTVLWSPAYAPGAVDADTYLIACEANGEVYVAGVQRAGTPAGYQTSDVQDFITIKYSRAGERRWVATWSGGASASQRPSGLVLGTKRDVFVAGHSWTANGASQAVLLRYRE